jgi:hypothetical protein
MHFLGLPKPSATAAAAEFKVQLTAVGRSTQISLFSADQPQVMKRRALFSASFVVLRQSDQNDNLFPRHFTFLQG